MNQSKVCRTLKQIFSDSFKSNVCIFIDGGWGVGKTYSILNGLSNDSDDNFSIKYVSVFGKSELDQIEKEIILQLLPITGSINKVKDKGAFKIFGNVMTSVLKFWDKDFNFLDLLNNLRIENISYEKSKEKVILCIDDLERKSPNIEIKDLLGLIERATTNFNVVFIANSSKFQDDREVFNEYKEKLIDYHFTIDELDHELLKQIANNKLRDIKNTGFISEIYCKNISGNVAHLMNIRIYNKYIDLVQRISEIVKKDFPENYFEFNEESLQYCIGVIVEVFLASTDKEKYKPRTNNKLMMHEALKSIFLYEEYNTKILEDYLIQNSEIAKDVGTLYSAHKLNECELEQLLKKIQAKMDERRIEYFKEPNIVVSLFDALNDLGRLPRDDKKMIDISTELYNPSIIEGPLYLEALEWDDFDGINIIPCNPRTRKFIDELNHQCQDKYDRVINEQYRNALNAKDIESLEKIIKWRSFSGINEFIEAFDLFFDDIVISFEEPKWRFLCDLVTTASIDANIHKFLAEREQSQTTLSKKLKYKKLMDILAKEDYIRGQVEVEELYSDFNG